MHQKTHIWSIGPSLTTKDYSWPRLIKWLAAKFFKACHFYLDKELDCLLMHVYRQKSSIADSPANPCLHLSLSYRARRYSYGTEKP